MRKERRNVENVNEWKKWEIIGDMGERNEIKQKELQSKLNGRQKA